MPGTYINAVHNAGQLLLRQVRDAGLSNCPAEKAAIEVEEELRRRPWDKTKIRRLLDRVAESAGNIGTIIATVNAIRDTVS
jgi:hypothetical protein